MSAQHKQKAMGMKIPSSTREPINMPKMSHEMPMVPVRARKKKRGNFDESVQVLANESREGKEKNSQAVLVLRAAHSKGAQAG